MNHIWNAIDYTYMVLRSKLGCYLTSYILQKVRYQIVVCPHPFNVKYFVHGPLTVPIILVSKAGAHGEDFAEQSSTNKTFLTKILTYFGNFLLRNCAFNSSQRYMYIINIIIGYLRLKNYFGKCSLITYFSRILGEPLRKHCQDNLLIFH